MDVIGLQGIWPTFPGTATPSRCKIAWGKAYLELADDAVFSKAYLQLDCPAMVTLTTPATRTSPAVTITVDYVLLRQTGQRYVIIGDQHIDGFWMVAHMWEDNLQGTIPKMGMIINDGEYNYEIKEVEHSNRRQRFRCNCLRKRS